MNTEGDVILAVDLLDKLHGWGVIALCLGVWILIGLMANRKK